MHWRKSWFAWLYSANVKGCASSALNASKALSWAGPHNQAHLLPRSSRSGCDSSTYFTENLPSWFTIPTKRGNSVGDQGLSIERTASVFRGLAEIQLRLMTCPRKMMLDLLNSHLSAFFVRLAFCTLLRAACSHLSCSY